MWCSRTEARRTCKPAARSNRGTAARNSSAEQEANAATRTVAEGRPLPGPIAARTGGTVQRSVLGDIGGTLLGAGALLGFAIGGAIGAIIGGLIGGVAGLAARDALTADKRGLTSTEQTEAELVFGGSLNYGAVKIAEAPIMAIGENARTPSTPSIFRRERRSSASPTSCPG